MPSMCVQSLKAACFLSAASALAMHHAQLGIDNLLSSMFLAAMSASSSASPSTSSRGCSGSSSTATSAGSSRVSLSAPPAASPASSPLRFDEFRFDFLVSRPDASTGTPRFDRELVSSSSPDWWRLRGFADVVSSSFIGVSCSTVAPGASSEPFRFLSGWSSSAGSTTGDRLRLRSCESSWASSSMLVSFVVAGFVGESSLPARLEAADSSSPETDRSRSSRMFMSALAPGVLRSLLGVCSKTWPLLNWSTTTSRCRWFLGVSYSLSVSASVSLTSEFTSEAASERALSESEPSWLAMWSSSPLRLALRAMWPRPSSCMCSISSSFASPSSTSLRGLETTLPSRSTAPGPEGDRAPCATAVAAMGTLRLTRRLVELSRVCERRKVGLDCRPLVGVRRRGEGVSWGEGRQREDGGGPCAEGGASPAC
ncbi:hypothetical protein G6O67_007024 [Ophiocordyceps sinensis]|uniref:Secreted protein n=1 Tax=Ophiocordyceps sinensis TaxID=72228 RepID=A0A8H4PKC3_9HYPO|nr:hypothetical protein G6O67_007024 [Ophiocordyceps sinensis]